MLHIENISYSVKGRSLLKNIELSLSPGRLGVIMGANGAGKSTLLKLIAGDIRPADGTLRWNGRTLSTYSTAELAKKRGVLRQQYQMLLPFTASQIIEMGRYPHFGNTLSPRCKIVIEEVAAYTGVAHLLNRNYLTLSGGEQQRVQLARVLAQVWDAPRAEQLILLDEPVSALDILFQHQLLSLVKQLASRGFLILAVLHDLNLAMQYADDVLLLKQGEMVGFGEKGDILNAANIQHTFQVEVGIHQHQEYQHPFITVKNQMNALTT